MTRLHVGPGCDDWDDDGASEPDLPSRQELRELEEDMRRALFDRAKWREDDRWAS